MSIWIALAVWVTEVVTIAALAASARGARIGVWLAIVLLPLPAFVQQPWWPPVFVLEVALLFAMFRGADLAHDRSLATFPRRLGHLVSLPDSRRIQRGLPRRFDARALLKLVVAGSIAAAAWWVVGAADRFDDWRHYALRWYVGGGPLPFAMFACLDGLLAFGLAAFGRTMPLVNRAPYLATSLSEFWSRRWNSIINSVLRDHVFRPLQGRGALVAMTATFVASAALHAYLIWPLMGGWAVVAWSVFFLAQIALMWIERKLRVRKWRAAWGHVWTLGALAVLYPLFVEPLLRLFERV